MTTATEQKEVATNSVETLIRMSEVAFSGMKRLTELNLSTMEKSLQQGSTASMSAVRGQSGKDQDGDDQDKAGIRLSGAKVDQVTAYMRCAQEIVTETQSAFARLMEEHLSSFLRHGRMPFPGMQVFEKIAEQTGDMTKTNLRAATEATEKLVATASHHGRKSA